MSFESFIGFRYLKARKSSAFVSKVTLISIGGVALGVCALIVVLSVMVGFENELRDRIIGTNAHGNLLKITYGFPEYRDAVKKVESIDGVVAATPFILREVMITSEANVTGALIKGIDIDSAQKVTKLGDNLVDGSFKFLKNPKELLSVTKSEMENRIAKGEFDPRYHSRTKRRYGEKELPGIFIGKELAKYLSVWVGDEINIVNPLGGGLGPTGPIPSNQYFRIAGVFTVGMYEYDMKFAYTTISALQDFASMDDEVTAVEFKVKKELLDETGKIGAEIVEKMGGFPYKVRDWRDMNKNLLSALQLERFVMFIILTFITLVAAFNIASTLIMMVIEKGKEISILKSMGASNFTIMKIFMLTGLVIGSIGISIGLIMGFGLCALIPIIDLKLDPEVYYMTSLAVEIVPLQVFIIVASALIISWFATLYPAWRAANLNPVDGLRNE